MRPSSFVRISQEKIYDTTLLGTLRSLKANSSGGDFAMTEFVPLEDAGATKAEPLRVSQRYTIKDPLGKTIEIPETAAADFAYFDAADGEGLRSYYEQEGYVVVRGLIDPDECDRAHAIFEREVKPSDRFIYRQATPGKLVQSMYFEGNPATWAHQDTYYLDSEHTGAMTAAWFAVEDIKPGAAVSMFIRGPIFMTWLETAGNMTWRSIMPAITT
jgi:hypothetical protein